MNNTVVKSLRIDSEMDKKITNLTKVFPMSKSAFMQRAIEEKVAEFEEYAQMIQDVKDAREGRTKSYTNAEMRQKYGL